MDAVNVVEAKKHFSNLMSRVAYKGERLVVERHGKPMMAWVNMDDLQRLELLEEDKLSRRTKALAALELAESGASRDPPPERRQTSTRLC